MTTGNDNSRLWMGIAGCALVFGFFMPWIDIAGLGGMSGWELVRHEGLSASTRFVLALCPIFGAALAFCAFTRSRAAAAVSLAIGASVIGYTVFKVGYAFVKITGWGLWLVLAAAAVAFVIGLASRKNA